jgi:hypothetical protein
VRRVYPDSLATLLLARSRPDSFEGALYRCYTRPRWIAPPAVEPIGRAPLREIVTRLETPWQLGRTLMELAELDQAGSDRAAAREHLTQATPVFEALGAAPDSDRARAMLAVLEYSSHQED